MRIRFKRDKNLRTCGPDSVFCRRLVPMNWVGFNLFGVASGIRHGRYATLGVSAGSGDLNARAGAQVEALRFQACLLRKDHILFPTSISPPTAPDTARARAPLLRWRSRPMEEKRAIAAVGAHGDIWAAVRQSKRATLLHGRGRGTTRRLAATERGHVVVLFWAPAAWPAAWWWPWRWVRAYDCSPGTVTASNTHASSRHNVTAAVPTSWSKLCATPICWLARLRSGAGRCSCWKPSARESQMRPGSVSSTFPSITAAASPRTRPLRQSDLLWTARRSFAPLPTCRGAVPRTAASLGVVAAAATIRVEGLPGPMASPISRQRH